MSDPLLAPPPTCYLCGQELGDWQITTFWLDDWGNVVEVHTACWDKLQAERKRTEQ